MVAEPSRPSHQYHVFKVGDMVWAKMKSQFWWPGHVYSEEIATPLVRQSKREGLILVAFFGASRYGWIDSSQLLPFDSNYAEMSQQTNSRNFLKAMGDAIDELSRRSDLALSCMCHNKHNIRMQQGFISVDGDGFDPKSVYSIDAIGKAREGLQPKLAVDFLRHLALEPTDDEDVDFIKKKATVMSYRKAVYGYNPVHNSIQESDPHQTPYKVPLNGRDESKEIKREKENVTSSPLPVHSKDPTSAIAESEPKVRSTDDEIRIGQESKDRKVLTHDDFPSPGSPKIVDFQTEVNGPEEGKRLKRTVRELGFEKSITSQNRKKQKKDGIPLVGKGLAKKMGQPEGSPTSDGIYETDISWLLDDLHSLAADPFNGVDRDSLIRGKKALLKFRSLVFQRRKNFSRTVQELEDRNVITEDDSLSPEPHKIVGPQTDVSGPENMERPVWLAGELEGIKVIAQDDFPSPASHKIVGSQTEVSKPEEVGRTEWLIGESEGTMVIAQDDFPSPGPHNIAGSQTEVSGPGKVERTEWPAGELEGRKVIPQDDFSSPGHQKIVGFQKEVSGLEKVPIGELGFGRSITHEKQKKELVEKSSAQKPTAQPEGPQTSDGIYETDLPQLLDELHSLAVDPFNTSVSRGPRCKGRKAAFLRFRSLVFKKSQKFLQSSVGGEPKPSKLAEDSVELPLVKLEGGLKQNASADKPPVKPEVGLKRGPSARQEEMAAAKKKRVGDIGNLIKEKKATKMIDVFLPGPGPAPAPVRAVKQASVTVFKRPGPEFIKKTEERGTMLMMKFPRGGSLPSFNELKARFVRYGPMDHSATRIFWNTFSCQVVFRHKAHAEAAYRFVSGSSSLFGNTGVRCILKEVGVVGLAEPEQLVKVPKADDIAPSSMVPVTDGQPKSILKKSMVEEGSGGTGRGRVKFYSDLTVDSGIKKFPNASAVTTTITTSPPPQYGKTVLAAPRGPMDPLMAPNTDIAQQMLSLLTRCKDVVAHVSCVLGYTPYHPL